MSRKLVLLLPWISLSETVLNKDPGLFLTYLSDEYSLEGELVYSPSTAKDELSPSLSSFRNFTITRLVPVKQFTRIPTIKSPISYGKFIKPFLCYLKHEAHNISFLFFFHQTKTVLLLAGYAKRLNPKIRVYVKSDSKRPTFFASKINYFFFQKLFHSIDLISTETTEGLHNFNQALPYTEKVALVPNGYDCDQIIYHRNPDIRKENLIVTISRPGAYLKNIELLLDILATVDLKDWNVEIIGPIDNSETDFNSFVTKYFRNNSHLSEKVSFLGAVTDRMQLMQHLERATIYISTSRSESFGIAMLEAMLMGDYLMATDTGAVRDLTHNGMYGFICPHSTEPEQRPEKMTHDFSVHLQDIINGEFAPLQKSQEAISYIETRFNMRNICKYPEFLKFFQSES